MRKDFSEQQFSVSGEAIVKAGFKKKSFRAWEKNGKSAQRVTRRCRLA
jgi:hypothetical protein